MPSKVNIAQALSRFSDHWSPKVVGDVGEFQVKLVKLCGAFDWHHHESEDELFLVLEGRLRMGLRDGDVDLEPGEFIVVPHGVEHCPQALSQECSVLLLEPNTTLNTGTVETERTVRDLERLAPLDERRPLGLCSHLGPLDPDLFPEVKEPVQADRTKPGSPPSRG